MFFNVKRRTMVKDITYLNAHYLASRKSLIRRKSITGKTPHENKSKRIKSQFLRQMQK